MKLEKPEGYINSGTPACLNGAIFRTDDGGRSWRQQPTTKDIGSSCRLRSLTKIMAGLPETRACCTRATAGTRGVTIASSKVAKTLRVARHTSNRNLFLGKNGLLMFRSGWSRKTQTEATHGAASPT